MFERNNHAVTPYESNRYDPFAMLNAWEKALWGDKSSAVSIRTDVRETDDSYILEAELPGFKKEDISVDISGDVLTVSAEHKEDKEEKDSKGRVIHSERSYGSYRRSYDLSDVEADRIDAEYTDGILKLTLPKKVEAVPASRRLEIK